MKILTIVNDILTLGLVVPILVVFGIYLTVRLGFPQITRLGTSIRDLIRTERDSQGNMSNFEAISAVLAGNLGTGNISGTAMAISLGGPGALFWMWVMAILGAIIKYASCFLGVSYRAKNQKGDYVGGPMFYLANGCHQHWLAIAFCIFSIITAFTVGNVVQVNSVILPVSALGVHPLVAGVTLAVLVWLVLLRDMRCFAKVASAVVPLMAFFYLAGACFILFLYAHRIPGAVNLVFKEAFRLKAASGGFIGFGVMKSIIVGFERGVLATDAGLGIASVLQSEARTKSPMEEGTVAMIAPWLVMIVCSITALVLLTTGAWNQPGLQSTKMCTWAFQQGMGKAWAQHLVTITLMLFAYTTILAWAYCAKRCVEYMGQQQWVRIFYYFFIGIIPLGALIRVELAWALADTSASLMLLVNVAGIIILSSQIIQESQFSIKEG